LNFRRPGLSFWRAEQCHVQEVIFGAEGGPTFPLFTTTGPAGGRRRRSARAHSDCSRPGGTDFDRLAACVHWGRSRLSSTWGRKENQLTGRKSVPLVCHPGLVWRSRLGLQAEGTTWRQETRTTFPHQQFCIRGKRPNYHTLLYLSVCLRYFPIFSYFSSI